jgi:predicted nucleic acid-binding protein
MSLEAAFWDDGALTPIFANQGTSASVQLLALRFSVVAWWGTTVEVQSALERLHRSAQITSGERSDALALVVQHSDRWIEIEPSSPLRTQAKSLLAKHPLRAADSLQLAAALIWCQSTTDGRTFPCSDAKLCDAASAEGFTVIRP